VTSPTLKRPEYFSFHNGEKAPLPFTEREYQNRLLALQSHMRSENIDVVVLTSMHNVAYFSGFLYCAFGRPYAAVVVETDHLTIDHQQQLIATFPTTDINSISNYTMQQRMIKSDEEIALITKAAAIADIGGAAVHSEIAPGKREIDVAMAGRDAMELAIAQEFPDAEYRDTWVWFQSGLNTDGAHNPVTSRVLRQGDILSLNAFPMISGYYTALERTLFVGEATDAELAIWQANIGAHELGLSLVKPGIKCSEVCDEMNAYFQEKDLLQYRTFGYGHSFGVLSHYYGREAGLEFREDIDTVLAPNMVVSIEPMLTLPEGHEAAGGYREHDILVVNDEGATNITAFPYGPEHNIVR